MIDITLYKILIMTLGFIDSFQYNAKLNDNIPIKRCKISKETT